MGHFEHFNVIQMDLCFIHGAQRKSKSPQTDVFPSCCVVTTVNFCLPRSQVSVFKLVEDKGNTY